MEQISKTLNRKARKNHMCDYCGLKIEKGSNYEISNFADCGDIWTWKSHEKCTQIAHKLNMFECTFTEGLTGEMFCENIIEEFSELNPDKNVSFSDQLEYVINHHFPNP